MTDFMTTISDERLAEMLAELVRDLDKDARNETIVRRYHVTAAEKALAALRAQGGVRVKPLEWREEGKGWFRAPSVLGTYHITHYAGMRSEGFKLEYGGGFTSYFNTLDEAKSAAQADYERRIMGALEASPAPVRADILAQTIWNEHLFHADALVYGDKMIVPDMAMAERLANIIVAALAAKGGQ